MTIKEEIQIEEYKRAFAEAYKQGFIDAMGVMKRHECSTGRCSYTQTEQGRTMTMTPKEFAEKMQSIVSGEDIELGHIKMDDLMCELLTSLGYGEGIKIFNDAMKWYS